MGERERKRRAVCNAPLDQVGSLMPLVFIPAQLRGLTGGESQVELPGESVREVVELLEDRFPGMRERLCAGDELAPGLQLSIDHVMTSRGLRAKLTPASELHFLPAFGGG